MPATLPFEVQEDILLNYFQDEKLPKYARYLISEYSVICRAWTAPCQKLLFRAVRCRLSTVGQINGIRAFYGASHRLASYVRDVLVWRGNPQTEYDTSYQSLLEVFLPAVLPCFPHVHTLRVHMMGSFLSGHRLFSYGARSQTVTTLSLDSTTLRDVLDLYTSYLNGFPNLRSLVLYAMTWMSSGLNEDTRGRVSALPSTDRRSPQISQLALSVHFDACYYIRRSDGFYEHTESELHPLQENRYLSVLRYMRMTLQHLDINLSDIDYYAAPIGGEPSAPLDSSYYADNGLSGPYASEMPVLQSLDIHFRDGPRRSSSVHPKFRYRTTRTADFLANMSAPQLEVLTIHFNTQVARQGAFFHRIAHLDDDLADFVWSPQFPLLSRTRFNVGCRAREYDVVYSFISDRFPRLVGGGYFELETVASLRDPAVDFGPWTDSTDGEDEQKEMARSIRAYLDTWTFPLRKDKALISQEIMGMLPTVFPEFRFIPQGEYIADLDSDMDLGHDFVLRDPADRPRARARRENPRIA
ncbi:hypothetical protein ACG7TL_008169 [Trametes sanguinea]